MWRLVLLQLAARRLQRATRRAVRDVVAALGAEPPTPRDIFEQMHPRGGDEVTHPSQLCKCPRGCVGGSTQDPGEHLPDCLWAAVRCQACVGTGCCPTCGGDGCAPEPAETPFAEVTPWACPACGSLNHDPRRQTCASICDNCGVAS